MVYRYSCPKCYVNISSPNPIDICPQCQNDNLQIHAIIEKRRNKKLFPLFGIILLIIFGILCFNIVTGAIFTILDLRNPSDKEILLWSIFGTIFLLLGLICLYKAGKEYRLLKKKYLKEVNLLTRSKQVVLIKRKK